jgi:hypothetical protein
MVKDGSEPFLAGVDGLLLVAPASSGGYLQVRAKLAVWPDGKIRWMDVRADRGSGAAPTDGTRLDALPAPVRPAAEEILSQLRSGSAIVLTAAELSSLPISDADRERAIRKLEGQQDLLKRASRAAADAQDGAWSIEAHGVVAMLRVADDVVVLQADARLEGDRVCLGPVRGERR